MPPSSISAAANAAIVSTTTTALGTMIGSWRPLMLMPISSPLLLTVLCSAAIDGVGLNAARNTTSLPSVIPPKMPPAWFVALPTLPSGFMTNASLFSLPAICAAWNPSPISKPLTAPIEQIAFARLALNLSNTGSPSPAGSPEITHSTMPPAESFSVILFSRYCSASAAASASGIYSLFFSHSAKSNRSGATSTGPIAFV